MQLTFSFVPDEQAPRERKVRRVGIDTTTLHKLWAQHPLLAYKALCRELAPLFRTAGYTLEYFNEDDMPKTPGAYQDEAVDHMELRPIF